MNIKNYSFDKTKVTAVLRDGNYLWIAFLAVDGIVNLRKVSVFDLNYIYFDISLSVDKITKMKIYDNVLYCAVEDTEKTVLSFSTSNPIGGYRYSDKPEGITQNSIDIAIKDNLFILLPGDISGTNSKILKYSAGTYPNYDETIDLSKSGFPTIYNARSMTIDANSNLWIVTYESPAKLIKVYEVSGGIYEWQTWTII